MRTLKSVLAFALLAAPLAAQQPAPPPTPKAPTLPKPAAVELQRPVQDTGIFSPLPMSAPDEQRRPDGAPGQGYWQQRVDYTISATLDTAAKVLKGEESIRYTNNSPDSLGFLWFQMDQNLFQPGSIGSLLNAQNSRFGGAGFDGGFKIESIEQVAGTPAGGRNRPRATPGAPRPLHTVVNDTRMRVDLASPLAPGQTTTIRVVYHFAIPEHGADRMGRDGSLYELAQWYPRLEVYDDVRGWNTDPYIGQGEFYLEYGDIQYNVTVPAGYIVAGSGVLQNPEEVLTSEQRRRLAQAAKSDTTIHIVTEADLTSGAARPKSTGMLTWRFKADSVRDVAWAAAPDYLWDASAWQGVLAQAYYRPSAKTYWQFGADMSRFTIQEYSTRWFRYPYPQISAVEGPVSGMEYPMLAMEANDNSKQGLYAVITHEIGHNWFPMIVGSNERRYPWMDEGFNTFINTYSEEDYFKRDDSRRRLAEMNFVLRLDQQSTAQPIMTPPDRLVTDNNLGSLAYIKPSIGLLLLRNKILGDSVFDTAFQTYIRRWAFRHPTPDDFFRTMENVSGRDLSWFWRGWFYTTDALDQAVTDVRNRQQPDSSNVARVTIKNLGQLVMPVELQLTLSDGSTRTETYPVQVWYKGDTYTAVVTTPKPVTAAAVNPDGQFPDLNAGNNGWSAPAPAATGGK